MKCEREKKEIIYWANILYQKGLITARSGNLSCRIGPNHILITRHDCYLGHLTYDDIVSVDIDGNLIAGNESAPSSEKDLHLAVYRSLPDIQTVVHSHSPCTTAFFHYFDTLDIFSFEAKFYLGNVRVIPQNTPTVTDIQPVVAALEANNITVLRYHGVVAIGKEFKEAVSLLELIEEQTKVNLITKSQAVSAGLHVQETQPILHAQRVSKTYKMLSAAHRGRLTELVNNDEQAQALGKQYGLTCTLAVKNQDTDEVMRFCYEQGRIVRDDDCDDAEFVIIGKPEVLKKVFNKEIDPFVASTQGKVKTKGDFAKMSRWYPVMVRTFKLWEEAPVE
ncbi:MAG: class II aldolase/adducin family protein [Candidatus Omnitrophica bacterium]|nr:class II aldolase/adducin family protein [Candidatus Omnitrophota bacterium]